MLTKVRSPRFGVLRSIWTQGILKFEFAQTCHTSPGPTL
jgi:hypothetical protein